MKVVIGIDVGGSTTKIVGIENTREGKNLIPPFFVRAGDPITSTYGAFGKFLNQNSLELNDVEKIFMTGVGSSHVTKPIYAIECHPVDEFESIGRGGLYLSCLDEAIVVSMGTGTAIVYAKNGQKSEYLGGTGVGGGTITGLARSILDLNSTNHVFDLANAGDLKNIDLRISDLTRNREENDLPQNMTAANFGKLSDIATKEDIALGIVNMVFETIGMMSIFAARSKGVKDIVLTGNLTNYELTSKIFTVLSDMFRVNFIIPKNSQFATVIGTALS